MLAVATGIPVATWEAESSETIASVVHVLQEQERNRKK